MQTSWVYTACCMVWQYISIPTIFLTNDICYQYHGITVCDNITLTFCFGPNHLCKMITLFYSVPFCFCPFSGQGSGCKYVHKTTRCVRTVVERNNLRENRTIYRRSPTAWRKGVVLFTRRTVPGQLCNTNQSINQPN